MIRGAKTRALRRLGLGVVAALFVYGGAAAVYRSAPLRVSVEAPGLDADADVFVARLAEASAQRGVRPGFEERLERRTPGRARVAILYIHGFGASRAEGEAVVGPLSESLGANVYYPRLPGHGESPEEHARQPFEAYVVTAEQALEVARAIGEHVLVIGTSTGGLLATWLAAKHGSQIHAVVLASPFYDFANPNACLLSWPGGLELLEMILGTERDARWLDDPERRKQPGFDERWMTSQRTRALGHLDTLRRFIARPEVFREVRVPVLLFHTTEERDGTVRVSSMHDAFAQFGGGVPHAKSRIVAVEDGSHVLLSAFVRSDKALILRELGAFVKDVGF